MADILLKRTMAQPLHYSPAPIVPLHHPVANNQWQVHLYLVLRTLTDNHCVLVKIRWTL